MAEQFQVTIDDRGDILVSPGWVIDRSTATTATFQVGLAIAKEVQSSGPIRSATIAEDNFIGGGGDSVEITGTLTGTFCPIGYFRQVDENQWRNFFGTILDFDPGAGTADLLDGANVIASASGLGSTPDGTYSSATYGETTYNGSSAFTLTVTHEGGGTDQSVQVMHVDAPLIGTEAPTGDFSPIISNFSPSVFGVWVSDEDPAWTLQLVGANTELDDGTDVVASGAAFSLLNPEAILSSTAYGETTYNSDAPFVVSVAGNVRPTRTGYAFVKLNLSAGSITSVTGPFFATSLPANSASLEVVPLAYSNGSGSVYQIHSGPIYFK